jgi:Transposase zinc-binding domain
MSDVEYFGLGHVLALLSAEYDGCPVQRIYSINRRGWQPEASNSANHHCPKCQASAAHRWLEGRQADLLPIEYDHVVVTLPASISAIARYNKAAIYGLRFDIAAETLRTIAADPAASCVLEVPTAMTTTPRRYLIFRPPGPARVLIVLLQVRVQAAATVSAGCRAVGTQPRDAHARDRPS